MLLTLFTLPKPFTGDTAILQKAAIRSWCLLDGVEVLLVGDEPGLLDAAAEVGAGHVASVARGPHGTPRLDDAFARVDAVATGALRAFVNADIVLLPDLLLSVERVRALGTFLLVGQTRELAITAAELDDREALRRRTLAEGKPRGAAAIDWVVFPCGLFDPMPPFVVGRAGFDNWLIWRGRQAGPVIDATHDVVAIHQPHGYGHLAAGKNEAYYGEEAVENVRLGGGKQHTYTLHDASHRLVDGRLRRHYGATFRTREKIRKTGWKLGLR